MPELDPRLFRMLARHFPYLQGFRLVAVSVFIQSVAALWLATRSELWTMVGGAGASLRYFGLLAIVHRYYTRFGRVVPAAPPRWLWHVFVFGTTFLLPLPSYGLPSVVWSALSAVPLWVAWECRPYRWHHVATSAAMMYVAFGRVAYPDAGDLSWMAPRMWVFTTTLAIGGILDHRLFFRAMRQTRVLATTQA